MSIISKIIGGGGGGLASLSADTSPQLGGTLDLNDQSLSATLDDATGDEIALDLSVTVNKATSGNYTALKVNAVETSAPGSDNRLLDLQVGGTPKTRVTNNGDLEIYNAYTDASNYERCFMRFNANQLYIGGEKAGTGTARVTEFVSPGALWLKCGANQELRIYDGSSLLWRVNNIFKGIFPATDIAQDIGIAGFRIRDIRCGRNVYFDGLPTADPTVAGQLWNNSGVLTVSAG